MASWIRFFFILLSLAIIFFLSNIDTTKKKVKKNCKDLNYLESKLIDINNFSSFEADLEISDWRRWQMINIEDLINFKNFNQFTNRERVKGLLYLRNINGNRIDCKFKVRLRPHGDQKDHREGNYLPSLQVKLINANIFGITDFLLLRPKQRGYYNEIFVSSLFRNIGLLAPRSSMVSINFNNQKYEFVFQEKIRKEFIEFSGFKEGPIIEGDERFVFNQGDVPFVNHRISNKNYPKRNRENEYNSEYSLSVLNHYGASHSNKIHRNWLIDYFLLSKLINRNDFVNLDLFDALMFATDSLAGLSIQDRRFYFNTTNKKFYPIFYDGIPNLISKSKKFIPKKINFQNLKNIDKTYISFTKPSMFEGKVSPSAKAGAKKALNLLDNLDLEKFEKELFRLGVSFDNGEINKIVNGVKLRLIEIDKFDKNKIFNFNQQNDNFFNNYFTKRYKDEKILFYSDNSNQYKLCNINYKNCELIDQNSFDKSKLFSQETKYKNKRVIFIGKKLTQNILDGWYFYNNESRYKVKKFSDFNLFYSDGISFETDEIHNKIIKIKKKLPESRVLIINQQIENWTFIFDDNTQNLKFPQNSILKDKNGNTGCITFYETKLIDVKFILSNSKCEDGINFVKSSGTINSINIVESISDAVDFDFSFLEIEKIDISNSRNDCVDFSFGKYQINYLNLEYCGDKAISLGENSNLNIGTANVKFSNIGIASKDSSYGIIDDYNFKNIQYCFAAYNKKQEFSGSFLNIKNGECKNYFKDIYLDNFSLIKKGNQTMLESSLNKNLDINDYKVKSDINLIKDVEYINVDYSFNAVIEIPKDSASKWQISKDDGNLELEFYYGLPRKIKYKAYPANYGIIPQTSLPTSMGGDGDPLDVFIIGEKIDRGEIVKVRPLGIIKMLDYSEIDDKIIAVKNDDKLYTEIKNLNDLNSNFPNELKKIKEWLNNYKGINVTNIIGDKDQTYAVNLIHDANKEYKKIINLN